MANLPNSTNARFDSSNRARRRRMSYEMYFKRAALASVTATVLGILCCLELLSAPAGAQTLTGRWAATGKTMDNGEVQRAILELTQTGDGLAGKLTALGYAV